MTTIKRPALRYYGGKWRNADQIIRMLPSHEHYVEPYGGAASVLLQKRRSKLETYNDLNGDVVEYFQVLRDHTDELMRRLALTPFARAEYERAYERSDDPIERARRFAVRSWQSQYFKIRSKSGWRVLRHLRGRSVAPAHDWVDMSHLAHVAERFMGVQIENDDAVEVIKRHDTPSTLFYVDPPYVGSTRVDKNAYMFEMTDEQHIELINLLKTVEGMVVLSGYSSDLYETELSGWEQVSFSARINSNEGAKLATEVVWIKPHDRHTTGMLSFEGMPA
jgi:DNA adenine methylase